MLCKASCLIRYQNGPDNDAGCQRLREEHFGQESRFPGMKTALFLICMIAALPAEGHQFRGSPYGNGTRPLPAPPSYTNIFGPGRSGVAPSTAIPERSAPVRGSSGGSRTGGVSD